MEERASDADDLTNDPVLTNRCSARDGEELDGAAGVGVLRPRGLQQSRRGQRLVSIPAKNGLPRRAQPRRQGLQVPVTAAVLGSGIKFRNFQRTRGNQGGRRRKGGGGCGGEKERARARVRRG